MTPKDYRFGSIMSRLPGMGQKSPTLESPAPIRQDTIPGGSWQNPPPQMQTGPDPQQDRASKFYEELKRIRGETGPGITAYKQALTQMPQEADYKPNWLTRVASGLSGFGAGMRSPAAGIETAMNLNRSGYRNAMEAYQNKLAGLGEQANLEQKELDTKAEMVGEAMKYGLNYDKYLLERDKQTSDIGHQRAQEQNWRDTAETSRIRADAAAREEYTYTPVQGGFQVHSKYDPRDPLNGQIMPAATVQDAQNRIAQQRANAATTQAGAAVQQAETGSYNAITNRGVGVARINNIQADTANKIAGVPLTPGSQNSARDLAVKELMQSEEWAPFNLNPQEYVKLPADERALFEEALERKIQEINNRRR